MDAAILAGSPIKRPALDAGGVGGSARLTTPQRIHIGAKAAHGRTSMAKRKQVKNACTNCQRACKKCDDCRPCARCTKYGLEEACVDSSRKARSSGAKRSPHRQRSSEGAYGQTQASHGSSSTADEDGGESGESSATGGPIKWNSGRPEGSASDRLVRAAARKRINYQEEDEDASDKSSDSADEGGGGGGSTEADDGSSSTEEEASADYDSDDREDDALASPLFGSHSGSSSEFMRSTDGLSPMAIKISPYGEDRPSYEAPRTVSAASPMAIPSSVACEEACNAEPLLPSPDGGLYGGGSLASPTNAAAVHEALFKVVRGDLAPAKDQPTLGELAAICAELVAIEEERQGALRPAAPSVGSASATGEAASGGGQHAAQAMYPTGPMQYVQHQSQQQYAKQHAFSGLPVGHPHHSSAPPLGLFMPTPPPSDYATEHHHSVVDTETYRVERNGIQFTKYSPLPMYAGGIVSSRRPSACYQGGAMGGGALGGGHVPPDTPPSSPPSPMIGSGGSTKRPSVIFLTHDGGAGPTTATSALLSPPAVTSSGRFPAHPSHHIQRRVS